MSRKPLVPHLNACLLSLCVSFIGCDSGEPHGLGPWREEVLLSDGRQIVVERYEETDVRKPIGDAGSAFISNTTIKFVTPADLAGLPALSMPYRPIILDYDREIETWFAIGVNTRMCLADAFNSGHMNASGRVNLHPNFEYRLFAGRWEEVEIGPERVGLPANLLIRRVTVEKWNALQRPVPLDEKRRLDSFSGTPTEYRQVQAHVGCG